VRVHLAREHALELEVLDLAFELRRVAGDRVDDLREPRLALELGELQEFERAGDAVAGAVEPADQRVELGALLAERLRLLGLLPDLRILELARDLYQPLVLAVVVKDTSAGRRDVPRGPSAGGGAVRLRRAWLCGSATVNE
jgi:hypothetical protein